MRRVTRLLSPVVAALTAAFVIGFATDVFAQDPAPPQEPPDPGMWEGTAGAGLALTSGNSDTLNVNVAFDVTRGPNERNMLKWTGLYLRGTQQEELVADRLSLGFRDQFALTERSFVFGQLDYLRDTFKLIDYLFASTVGAGYNVVDSDRTKFSVDGGLGIVWEKNPDVEVRTDMALTAAEKFEHAVTETATIKQAVTGLWKADDLADGLYTFSLGLAAKVSENLQLSVDVLNTFQNRPPTPETRQNDVALITAITAKF